MTRPIRWRVAFASPPAAVHRALTTQAGRESFWAAEAPEVDGAIRFRFPNGVRETSPVTASDAPARFELVYFGAPTRFRIEPAGGGAVLTLEAEGVTAADWADVHAGWVSVLLQMKAAVDHGIDLRNHDADRTWDAGFVDQ